MTPFRLPENWREVPPALLRNLHELHARQHCSQSLTIRHALVLPQQCQSNRLREASIAIRRSGSFRPQALDLESGELFIMRPLNP